MGWDGPHWVDSDIRPPVARVYSLPAALLRKSKITQRRRSNSFLLQPLLAAGPSHGLCADKRETYSVGRRALPAYFRLIIR